MMAAVSLTMCAVSWGLDEVPNAEKVEPGAALFETHCAACHNDPNSKAPRVEALAAMSFDDIMLSLEFGRMQPQAAGINKIDKAAIARYLSADSKVDETWMVAAQCDDRSINLSQVISPNWGLGKHNQRYLSDETAGINLENVGRLKLKWAFAYPQVTAARSQPVLTADTLFVGAKSGDLFALDRSTGCIKWRFKADSSVRSAVILGQRGGLPTLFFGDTLSSAYAVDAASGQLLWKKSLSIFPTSVITGSPAYHEGVIYMPISSYEIAAAGMPNYPCCHSHGAVVALNADTGEEHWTWHAMGKATPQGKNDAGRMRFGPSGASVWTTPTIDAARGVLYIGTAENMSHPATDTSDAIIALNLDDGKTRWKYQALKNDVWNAACLNGGPNCPENAGQDFDFGASVVMTQNREGKDVLLAGQKSGAVYALDPDGHSKGQGKVIWTNFETRNNVYSPNPGVHWGMAVSGQTLFVPIADSDRPFPNYQARPGVYALDVTTGKAIWGNQVSRSCDYKKPLSGSFGLEAMRKKGEGDEGTKDKSQCSFHFSISAAVTATDELLMAGGLDGILRAYNSRTGDIVWKTETAKAFDTVNGVAGHGGAIDVDGPVMGGGMLFIHSGYSMFGQLPGNVLLAFEVEQP